MPVARIGQRVKVDVLSEGEMTLDGPSSRAAISAPLGGQVVMRGEAGMGVLGVPGGSEVRVAPGHEVSVGGVIEAVGTVIAIDGGRRMLTIRLDRRLADGRAVVIARPEAVRVIA